MDFSRKENKFSIYVYCLEKDINFKKEKRRLMKLYYEHGLFYETCYGLIRWEPPTKKKKENQLIQIIHQLIFLL